MQKLPNPSHHIKIATYRSYIPQEHIKEKYDSSNGMQKLLNLSQIKKMLISKKIYTISKYMNIK
jgi:hypothetical protein